MNTQRFKDEHFFIQLKIVIKVPKSLSMQINLFRWMFTYTARFRPGIAIRSVPANCTYKGTRELRWTEYSGQAVVLNFKLLAHNEIVWIYFKLSDLNTPNCARSISLSRARYTRPKLSFDFKAQAWNFFVFHLEMSTNNCSAQ